MNLCDEFVEKWRNRCGKVDSIDCWGIGDDVASHKPFLPTISNSVSDSLSINGSELSVIVLSESEAKKIHIYWTDILCHKISMVCTKFLILPKVIVHNRLNVSTFTKAQQEVNYFCKFCAEKWRQCWKREFKQKF